MKNCIRQAFYEMDNDEELDQFIRRQAKDTERSISYVVRKMLWEAKVARESVTPHSAYSAAVKHEGTVT